jgi:hypothetical protein
LIDANADGEFPNDDIPLPADMMLARKEEAEFLANKPGKAEALQAAPSDKPADTLAAIQGPRCRIGPKNPDHPNVKQEPGGRDPS